MSLLKLIVWFSKFRNKIARMPYGQHLDSTMHIAQVSSIPGENVLNSSHSSLKILLGEMFCRLRISRQELGELLSLSHEKLLRTWKKNMSFKYCLLKY